MEQKIERKFIYRGYGFPVKFTDVPMIKVRGEWTPDVDYQAIAKEVLRSVALKPVRLTGSEVRFVRLQLEMTLQEFAKRFDVSHVAVLKWEKAWAKVSPMSWSMEKDLRLFVLRSQGASEKELGRVYAEFEAVPADKGPALEVRAGRAA